MKRQKQVNKKELFIPANQRFQNISNQNNQVASLSTSAGGEHAGSKPSLESAVKDDVFAFLYDAFAVYLLYLHVHCIRHNM